MYVGEPLKNFHYCLDFLYPVFPLLDFPFFLFCSKRLAWNPTESKYLLVHFIIPANAELYIRLCNIFVTPREG